MPHTRTHTCAPNTNAHMRPNMSSLWELGRHAHVCVMACMHALMAEYPWLPSDDSLPARCFLCAADKDDDATVTCLFWFRINKYTFKIDSCARHDLMCVGYGLKELPCGHGAKVRSAGGSRLGPAHATSIRCTIIRRTTQGATTCTGSRSRTYAYM